jgi:tRNA splicing endonuclease
MLIESKTAKGMFEESDAALSGKFSEAGFGFLQEGGCFFHPLEAGYLARLGKSEFAKMTLEKFLSSRTKKDKSFSFAFSIYCAIRGTGRIIRPYMEKTNFFRVYAPGVGRYESRPSQLVCLLPGNFPAKKSLEEQVRVAHLTRLDLIIACGTAEQPRFYKISSFNF